MSRKFFLTKRDVTRSSKKIFTAAWVAYHVFIVAAFLFSLIFTRGIHIDADFYNMIPGTQESKAAKIAENSINKNSNATVFMLASHEDFAQAKQAAEKAYSVLSKNPKFASLALYQDLSTSTEILDFLGNYRYQLLSEENCAQLSSDDGAEEFAQTSLEKIFGGFSLTGFDNLQNDPFLLDEVNLTRFLSAISDAGTSMQPKDGVLASKFKDRWYIMLRGELVPSATKLASKENAVPDIYATCLPLETDGVRFVFSGTTFHSFKSSSSAATEISIISTVSMLAVLVILLAVFRTGIPIICSFASIFIAMIVSFCATHLVFGNLHLMTLIFGTSLIGSSIDYSLHYFINWKANKTLTRTIRIRRHIFAGLILSLISTEICYAMLLGAPFTMLKQMALFSFVGIFSSFLTATGMFPLFKIPAEEKRIIPIYEKLNEKLSGRSFKKLSVAVPLVIFVSTLVILGINHSKVKIQNNISNLYKMEGRLKDDTFLAFQVLNYNPTSWLIVSGDTMEEVLQTEEKLASQIPDTFISTSKFIPSIKSQKKSIESAKKLLQFAPSQFEYFGFDEEGSKIACKEMESFLSEAPAYLTPENRLPSTLQSLLNMIWIGKVDSKYYSIMLPSAISEESAYIKIASENENVYYENKVKDISSSLDHLTNLIVMMFCLSFVVIIVIMKFFYTWKETLKIASIPVLSVLVILSVFTIAGLKLEFFCITGIILVFGLGLDYVIYKLENKSNSLETFAIALSFVTTALSFGALALSSFVPVHVLGLSIFSGLITAFICAIL
ncbi:MAG: hypothetical protein KBT11_09690 [Treponema sp.]|nr:hypothetical protein [Candidatus Treponema equifaecale]